MVHRSGTRAGRFMRPAHLLLPALSAFVAASMAAPAGAQPFYGSGHPEVAAAVQQSARNGGKSVRAFYEARRYRPLWIRGNGFGPEADYLLELASSAELDGVDRGRLRPARLAQALDRAQRGSPKALAAAELLLSETFAEYVQAMRRTRGAGMHIESEALLPAVPTDQAALDAAASARSLDQYLRSFGWMHPYYAGLRNALANPMLDQQNAERLRLNLERVRALPAGNQGRYILVDTAAAQLYMYENGQVRDTMRVVVGKSDQQTPMMAGFIRYAILNPYWNIPPDLVATKVAPGVAKQGAAYLKANRYQILSDWSETPTVLASTKVDWRAVLAGREELRVRQLPGPGNGMGNVKFMFPNDLGIYLHDTPDKQLMRRASRQFSSGCVRLEDAARLGRWLYGKPLVAPSPAPEQKVQLPEPVPVYLTYLTAAPEAGRIAYRPDTYGRDRAELAAAAVQGQMRGTR
jgi:murein L,D-transpeptidase YcbB/YkuD